MAQNLYSFYLDSKEQASRAVSRVFGWEFTGFPCEKCVDQVIALGVRPIGAKGECLICGETMKAVQFGPEESELAGGILKGEMRADNFGVAHLLFDHRLVANGVGGWFEKKSLEIEPEVESTTFGAAVEVSDPENFDPLSFKLVRLEKGVLAVIGEFREGFGGGEEERQPEEKGSPDASVKMAERMGYKW